MSRVWLAILLAAAGTMALRASFLAAAHRLRDLPPGLTRILRQIPPAALAALVAPALVAPEGHIDLTQPRLFAGLIAVAIAWRTRNVIATLVVGMLALVLLRGW